MYRRVIIFHILFYFFTAGFSLCQQDTTRLKISRVRVAGNSRLSAREIEKMVPSGDYTVAQLREAIHRVLQRYRQRGNYFSHIDVADSGAVLKLSVTEGPLLRLKKIVITTQDSLLRQEIESRLDIRQPESVAAAINLNADQVLDYLENNGYPFGEILVDSLSLSPAPDSTRLQLTCYFRLEPGPLVAIDSIVVRGNTLTRRDVIVRELRIKRGEIYNHNRVARARLRLLRTGWFNQVAEPEIFVDKQGRGYLAIAVKEGSPNQLNAVLGYNPAATNREKGYLTGLIDVAFNNLLGTGREVTAYWQKKDRRSQELRFHYVEPWVAGYPINMGGGFQQTIQDTSFIRRNLEFEIKLPFSDVVTFNANVGTEEVLPDSIGQVLYQLPRSSSWLAKIGFRYDTRNDFFNPSRGVLYQTQFEYARKNVSPAPFIAADQVPSGRFRRDRWLVDIELYLPTLRWQTVLLGIHGRRVKSNEKYLPLSDLFRFGGTGSVRGYREEEFWGQKVAWFNLEYRYLLARRSRVFLFLDGGYFWRKDRQQNVIKDDMIGYGFGLRIETRLGLIGIDYGLGQGRGLTDGLVHVGLTNKF